MQSYKNSKDRLKKIFFKEGFLSNKWASLVAQRVMCLLAIWETQIQSLGWEDPLEKEMATHSRILAWKTPWTEDPGGLQSMGSPKLDTIEQHSLFLHL